tara:strand:- start:1816 stop:2289 length:474 start_codon:yes stop_codon:yes gene_type:complete
MKKKINYLAFKFVFLIIIFNSCLAAKAFTIKSGQVISSDGKVYEFASPKEAELLIKKKDSGKSLGVFNNNLFLIVDERILHIPLQDIISSTDTQIYNLVNKKTDKFFKKNNLKKSKKLIINRLYMASNRLKKLHLINKLQNKISNKSGSYISFYLSF